MADMLSFKEIAKRLGVDPTTVRRLISRKSGDLKIKMQRGKGAKLLLDKDDVEKLVNGYEERRGPISPATEASDNANWDRKGYFYIVQIAPDLKAERVKVGFAEDVDKRLTEHRTAAPTAELLKKWPCKRSWENAAIDSITREECKFVLNEEYEGDTAGFIARGDALFNIMPNPKREKELSDYSPLKDGPNKSIQRMR